MGRGRAACYPDIFAKVTNFLWERDVASKGTIESRDGTVYILCRTARFLIVSGII